MIPCQTYILCIRSECIHILIPKQASQWSRWFLPQGLCTSSPSFPRLTTSYWSMPISNTSSPETSVPCSLLLPHALQPWPSSNLWLEQIRKVSVKPSVKWKQKKILILYFSLGFFYAFVPTGSLWILLNASFFLFFPATFPSHLTLSWLSTEPALHRWWTNTKLSQDSDNTLQMRRNPALAKPLKQERTKEGSQVLASWGKHYLFCVNYVFFSF